MMNKEIIRSDRLDEQYTVIHHKSGLDVYVWKKEGFQTTEALFGTKYGSVNTRFKTKKTGKFIDVPEGIAHYLEHKLFENEDTDVFDLYAKTGANANAYTSFESTAYTFSTSENWEQALEILLDFVQKPYFTKETVEKEQGIIGQEIKMCADSPDRQCFFNLLKALFVNHPVKIDIAGTVESISHITPELLYDCYYTFYNLNNMALSIAGNVDEEKVIEICDKMLKPCEDIQLETAFPEEPETVAQKKIVQKFPVGVPIFSIGFKAPSSKGRELLKRITEGVVLMRLLIGTTSPLHKELFEEGLINSQFGIEVFCGDGYFASICSGESHDPEEVYRRLCAEIERVKKEGIDEKRFEICQKSRFGDLVRAVSDVESCAAGMLDAHFNGTTVFDEADIMAELTVEDCYKALDVLFNTENSSISIAEN